MLTTKGATKRTKCHKCPQTLVYVMTNGLEGKMFSSKSFISKSLNELDEPKQSTETPTSTIPPTTTTSTPSMDFNPLIVNPSS